MNPTLKAHHYAFLFVLHTTLFLCALIFSRTERNNVMLEGLPGMWFRGRAVKSSGQNTEAKVV